MAYRVGWIPYWNLYPFYRELLSQERIPIKILKAHPSLVNLWLANKKVDFGPASSICLLHYEKKLKCFPLGLSAEGSIKSVYLGFDEECYEFFLLFKNKLLELSEIFKTAKLSHPQNIQAMVSYIFKESKRGLLSIKGIYPYFYFTKDSATSVALSKVVLMMLFGVEEYKKVLTEDSGRASVKLVIGDKALAAASSFPYKIDLGKMWFELTGLPFVYALWQTSVAVDKSIIQSLCEIAKQAEKKIDSNISLYLPSQKPLDDKGVPIDLISYWRVLRYCLQQRDIEGLRLYVLLVREFEGIKTADDFSDSILEKMKGFC
jgi:predicted solute-binding protein